MSTQGFDSGGFLTADESITDDFGNVVTSLEGRPWTQVVGTWTATNAKATTSTARGSDPRLILGDAPFSDFEMSADVGLGDAFYLRYVDANNWLRVTHHMDYSSSSYACNPYACNPYACNPYSCNPYSCNPYSCNPYSCNPYSCNPYSCNCVDTYASRTAYVSSLYCCSNVGGAFSYEAVRYGCDACPGGATCGTGSHSCGGYSCAYNGGCTVYTGQSCQTCYQTCYETCYQTCYQTCYDTCYDTCYQTCYQTCYDYFYPTVIRLEKMVAGTLTLVTSINLGTHYAANANADYRTTRMRVVGRGTNIQVFTHHNISANPCINATVSEHVGGRRFGIGRHGYGNQDSGNTLDNLVLTNAK